MRSVLLHCKEINANINGLSTRGIEVSPEEIKKDNHNNQDCIVAFITVEENDDIEKFSRKMSKEIEKFCNDTKEQKVVLFPFAHLSNKLAPFKIGIKFFDYLEKDLMDKFETERVHFGSDKELLIRLFGHPGNARYREF